MAAIAACAEQIHSKQQNCPARTSNRLSGEATLHFRVVRFRTRRKCLNVPELKPGIQESGHDPICDEERKSLQLPKLSGVYNF